MYSSVHLQKNARSESLSAFPVQFGNGREGHHSYLFLVDQGASELDRMIVAVTARKLMHHGHVYIADVRQGSIEEWEGICHMPLYGGALPRVGMVTTVAVFRNSRLAMQAAKAYPKAEVFVINHELIGSAAGQSARAAEAELESLPL
ncbi:MAG: hypothetical protein V4662_09390 [Verrucomicrobiota bacterium]